MIAASKSPHFDRELSVPAPTSNPTTATPILPQLCQSTGCSSYPFGIWLWPDNQSEGELEDFVARMIPNDDPVWPLSKEYIDGIPKHCRKFAEKKTTRAQVHAWLATRETPGFMGSVVGEDDLEVDGAFVTRFANWLRLLFG